MKHSFIFPLNTILLVFAVSVSGCYKKAPTPLQPVALKSPPTVWVASEHFVEMERTAADIDSITIHTTEGSYKDELSFEENHARCYEGNVRYLTKNDRGVSAHFVLGPKGEITQQVKIKDMARTQTYYNMRSIGIECAGWSFREQTWTPELLDTLVELCANLAIECDVPIVHPEGTAYEGPHSRPTRNELRRPEYKTDFHETEFDAPGIVGHFQVQPWNKRDPGPHFPWDEFMERVEKRAAEIRAESGK